MVTSLHTPIDAAKDTTAKLLKMLERDGYLLTEGAAMPSGLRCFVHIGSTRVFNE